MPELMKVEVDGREVERPIIGYSDPEETLIGSRSRKGKAIPLPQPYAERDEMVLWRVGSMVPMIVKVSEDLEK